ncbi:MULTISPECIES: hypothetical protein [Virgibacillus]|uniref:YfhD family protein n=2 Tax=Virgibacillus TaxID=84406 RepID=A0A024QF01_9BACI|nr:MULTISPECIES: hypothetical protein [Virgibacillus]EQB38935.1 hypothetical protein M948_00900 [Virgibacillus sp. CM-4]GGJ67275.1 hypothetical protein GCM10007111_31490 [Virgibacillus kapii]CDQ41059.1 hypothetical protein BN990_03411 [Virgibacillus massiliensis]
MSNEHKPEKRKKDIKEDRTKLDEFEDQKHVDAIPLEDLRKEMKEEKQKRKSKNSSQSE